MNYFWAFVIAILTAGVAFWVRGWKWPTPATLKCRVKSVQPQEGGYSLQLEVLETTMPAPADIFQKWARPYVQARLPKAGQAHTFWVPKEKMRADLQEGSEVAITGRLLRPVGGGVTELSIHESLPLAGK